VGARLRWASAVPAEYLGAATAQIGPHFARKAKNIIFLFMTGGPSQVDMLNPKAGVAEIRGPAPGERQSPHRAPDWRIAALAVRVCQTRASGIGVSEMFHEALRSRCLRSVGRSDNREAFGRPASGSSGPKRPSYLAQLASAIRLERCEGARPMKVQIRIEPIPVETFDRLDRPLSPLPPDLPINPTLSSPFQRIALLRSRSRCLIIALLLERPETPGKLHCTIGELQHGLGSGYSGPRRPVVFAHHGFRVRTAELVTR